MRTPTPEALISEHSAFLRKLDHAIQEAIEGDACLEIDELLITPPACDDAFDVGSLATEVNMRIIASYLMGADNGIDEICQASMIHDSAKAAAELAMNLTIAATAKALGVDKYLLWSTLMCGEKIHAPTVHLYDDSERIWVDGRTREKVSPPE